ncbi:MAG: hypothetical protein JWN52_2657 [Actinomycetia bacterium]|nr:hypothetical protein [Actinomycetes bacterium]
MARVAPVCSLNGQADRYVTIERWTRVDGTRTANVVVHARSAAALPPQPRGANERNMQPRSGYPYLLSLPTDPNALLAAVSKQATPTGGAFSAIEVPVGTARSRAAPAP